jgi:putative ABC transport system permease protein
MFNNYLKTAIRNLLKNKGFTAINVLGLSLGLATCLLIVFYVKDELSYDKYNAKSERIYRVDFVVKFGNNANSYAAVAGPIAGELKKDFPSVEQAIRLRPLYEEPTGYRVKKGSVSIPEKNMIYADPGLFDIFSFPMINGNPSTALTEPNTVVITESTAKKYFNSTNVVGQSLIFDDSINFKITGVIKDLPRQSHFNFDFFLSMATSPGIHDVGWGGGGYNTYVLLKPGTDYNELGKKLSDITMENVKSWMKDGNDYIKTVFRPLGSIHLQSNLQQELGRNGSIQYVYIFSAIAIFILLIACVNFMNLSTARSANRAREVGVRKVLGSPRKYLIAQFLTESMIVTFISTVIAVVVAWALLPLFNQISGKVLSFNLETFTWLMPLALGLVVVIGFLAGCYPAFFMSAFQPIDVLKGKLSRGFKGGGLRSGLVVFQFSISIFLIIGSLVIYDQLQYIQTKDLGYNRSQVLILKNTGGLKEHATLFKEQVSKLHGVISASMTSYIPTEENSNITALFPDATINSDKSMLTEFWPVDEDYIKTLGMQIKQGRDFSRFMKTDSSAIIINEAAAKFLGFKNPINQTVYNARSGIQPYHIVGVMKDFHFKSLRENISPVVLYLSEDRAALNVKVSTANIMSLINQIKDKWKTLTPNQQLDYSFMDADFDAAYRAEDRIGEIFISFTVLAIVIACLGLFGLATYAAEQRTKEIGIRKVLGANVFALVGLLSKDFIKLIFIAIIITSPLAWVCMQKWLQSFAYRVEMKWWILAIAAGLSVLIAFITISFQSTKAAFVNPVDSLKTE